MARTEPIRRLAALAATAVLGALAWSVCGSPPAVLAEDAEPVELPRQPRRLDPREHGVGQRLPDVTLIDLAGKSTSLSAQLAGATALVVVSRKVDCPLCRKYAPALARLEESYGEQGVRFLFVNVAPKTDADELRRESEAHGFDGAYVLDPELEFARTLGVTSTTDVFVIDPARTLAYRGAVDDQYGFSYAREAPRRTYLRDALAAVLARKRPRIEATSAPGCAVHTDRLAPPPGVAPTYHEHIERIVQRHCQKCHRPGEAAPFPLLTYDDVEANADMIRLVVEQRLMPPWFADGEQSVPMSSDHSLTPRDRKALLSWIDAGLPRGDPAAAPVPVSWTDGWKIGTPDAVLAPRREFPVPAEGVVDYLYVNVPITWDEDRWIRGFELRPSGPQVVHHILVFVRFPSRHPEAKKQPEFRGGLNGYFVAMVPGQTHLIYPEGMAKRLPADGSLMFQIHYTPNGTAVKEKPTLGLLFADGPPEIELRSQGIPNTRFSIPPGASNHPVRATYRFTEPGRILAFMPHMHLRGKAFRYELELPDGEKRRLLEIPRYDFNWQLAYTLQEPIDVPAGARLLATGWFDNSADNPANPDPTKTVRFGEQTFEEMMIGYFDWHPRD